MAPVVLIAIALTAPLTGGPARRLIPAQFRSRTRVACENTKTRRPALRLAGQRDRATPRSRASPPTSASTSAARSTSRSRRRPSSYHIDIYRLGYYGGNGARLIAHAASGLGTLPQTQPACLTDAATGLIDCGNWAVSASWTVPATAVSGIYIAKLVRNDTGGASHIFFVVRDDASHSDARPPDLRHDLAGLQRLRRQQPLHCTVSCPSGNPRRTRRPTRSPTTGRSTARCSDRQRARRTRSTPSTRWSAASSATATTSATSPASTPIAGGALLPEPQGVHVRRPRRVLVGRRSAPDVEAARDAGVNLAFFSGNEVFWKTRWENSIDGSNTAYRTLVTYKETHVNAVIDPQDPTIWTGTWRDPRFSPPADGGRPENALTGRSSLVNGHVATSRCRAPSASCASGATPRSRT